MNYGLSMFLNSSENLPSQFSVPEFWKSGQELHERIQPVFLGWLREQESANKSLQSIAPKDGAPAE